MVHGGRVCQRTFTAGGCADVRGMRVTGVDACRRGWVAVTLEVPTPGRDGRVGVRAVRVHGSLDGVLEGNGAGVVGIDMPLGLLESGWREADLVARGLLGVRRSSVFAIPPRAVGTSRTTAPPACVAAS